jgi:hypothetical protein
LSHLHIPQRLTGESFDAYKTRRAQSHAINKANRTTGQGGISSRKSLRDEMRKSGTMGKRTRAYVALCAAWAAKRVAKSLFRDENGAYTCTGGIYQVEGMAPDTNREHVLSSWVHGEDTGYTARRKWLGGISAQRGY